ncbi:MAG: metalloregulator ArsR/SmtB family transcription factor [Paracoccaceae bacterium]
MDNQKLDALYHVLSDATRRAVVERLTRGPASVSELAEPHDIALPTFLKHLKVLEKSGLVRSEKAGRIRTCHIEAAPLRAAEDWLAAQRRLWEGRLDRLQVLAERLEAEAGTEGDQP